jgi:stage II sporulation SpoE-like protein/GAF domain-containing protein/PAS domain-containing protein
MGRRRTRGRLSGDAGVEDALAASAAAVAVLRGHELVVEYANPAHRAMFGWPPGWSLRRHAAAEKAVALFGLAEGVLSTGTPAHAAGVSAGSHRIAHVTCSPVAAGTADAGVLLVALDTTSQARALRLAEDESQRLILLDQATTALNTDMDPRRELIALAESVVPSLADACAVYLIDQAPRPGTAAPAPVHATRLVCVIDPAVGVRAPTPEIRLPLADTRPMSRAVATRQIVTAHGAELREQIWGEGWLQAMAPHSLAAVPLGGEQVLAVVDFLASGDRPPYQPSDLALMREITARADVAVGHALRLQLATEVAMALQRGLLSDPATVDWLDIAVRYRPAVPDLEVGGDWYDTITLPDGGVGLTVGDVVGHDLYAVSTMGQLRSMVQALACQPGSDPGTVLTALNDLSIHLEIGHYATVVQGRLTRADHGATLTWANAGHPPPVLVTPDGSASALDNARSPMLGLTAVTHPQTSIHIDSGSTLLLYTDGLIENPAKPSPDPIADLAATVAAHAELDVGDLCDLLLNGAPIVDDIALLAVRVR